MFYRERRLTLVEAMKYDGRNADEVAEWVNSHSEAPTHRVAQVQKSGSKVHFTIETPDGQEIVNWGDYVVKVASGGFFTYKPDVFEAQYEAVES